MGRDTDADGSVEVEQGLLNSDIIGRDQHLESFHLANIGKHSSWQLLAWRSAAHAARAPLRRMRGQDCGETFGGLYTGGDDCHLTGTGLVRFLSSWHAYFANLA